LVSEDEIRCDVYWIVTLG